MLHRTPFLQTPPALLEHLSEMAPGNLDMLFPHPASLYSGLLHLCPWGLSQAQRGPRGLRSLAALQSSAIGPQSPAASLGAGVGGVGVGWCRKAGQREDGSDLESAVVPLCASTLRSSSHSLTFKVVCDAGASPSPSPLRLAPPWSCLPCCCFGLPDPELPLSALWTSA